MTRSEGPTLTFTSEQWAHLHGEGKLPTDDRRWGPMLDNGDREIHWDELHWSAQRIVYQALVRAASRGERRLRLVMADHLRRLGYELIPDEE